MTPLQYDRWRDFSLRMARTCFRHRRRPDTKWIVDNVVDFFDCLNEDTIQDIVDWDSSPMYICEHMREFSNSKWYDIYELLTLAQRRRYERIGKDARERFRDKVEERYCSYVECCVRAGLDCAASQPGGVMGFTAGDLRRMYPEPSGVPEWVTGSEPWNTVPITGMIPGAGYSFGEPRANGMFNTLADDESIWL